MGIKHQLLRWSEQPAVQTANSRSCSFARIQKMDDQNMQLFADSTWERWFMSHGKSCCMCGHHVMNVEIKQPKAHCKQIEQQWMRESKGTLFFLAWLSHGHGTAKVPIYLAMQVHHQRLSAKASGASAVQIKGSRIHAGIMCLRYHVCGLTPASSQIRVRTGDLFERSVSALLGFWMWGLNTSAHFNNRWKRYCIND